MTKHLEDFDVADQSGLAGLDLTWDDTVTGSGGTWKIVTNAAEIATIGASATIIARAEHDTGSPDMYVSAPVTHFGGASSYVGVAVRMNASDGAFYDVEIGNEGSGTNVGIYRYNTSGLYQATVATATITIPGGTFILALQAEGTSLRAYVDGVLAVSGTDGNITTGQRGGVAGYIRSGGATNEARWLAFETGALTDLGTLITPTQAAGSGSASAPSLTTTATIAPATATATGAAGAPTVLTGGATTITPATKTGTGAAGMPTLLGVDALGVMRRVGGYPSPSRISPATGPRALANL